MIRSIFCPSAHLILATARCPECGWERPASAEVGGLVWGPVELGAGLGGPGRHIYAKPVILKDMVAFPLNNREIVALDFQTGKERWRTTPDEGLVTRHLMDDGKQIIATLSDERPIGHAAGGKLIAIDHISGEITTLWNADGHQLTPPVLMETQILLRTSTSELISLKKSERPKVQWKVRLSTWWALAPIISDEKVLVCDGNAMQGEGRLAAHRLDNGEGVWTYQTDGMLTQTLASDGERVIFQNGRKQITALDLTSGDLIWEINADRLYTAPVLGKKHLYVAARGKVSKGESGYYLLMAIDSATGQPIWEAPLPSRVMIPPLWFDNRVYLGAEDGRLLGLSDRDGSLELDTVIGNAQDPLSTHLLIADGILLAGSYYGKAFGVQVAADQEKLKSPQSYIEQGDFESAAAAHAINGDFRKSAKLYADELHDVKKALALYDHGKLYHEAGDLASSHDMLQEAENYYKLTGDWEKQVEMLLLRGDNLVAARLFEQNGKLKEAAKLFEDLSDIKHARELYRQVGDIESILRLLFFVPAEPDEVTWAIGQLENQGRLADAVNTATKAGMFRKAADLYQQLGNEQEELNALLMLVENEPQRFAFENITKLARKAGRFVDAANAWEWLAKHADAAKTYELAARQASQSTSGESELIAGLYVKAAENYAKSGQEAEEQVCREFVARFREWPIIRILGKTTKEFRELDENTAELFISNVGFGIASEITWEIDESKFKREPRDEQKIKALGVGLDKKVVIHITPRKDVHGEGVGFFFNWSWKSKDGIPFQGTSSIDINVKRADDSRPTPTHIVVKDGGTVIQDAGGVVFGDPVYPGGQKGDRIEMHRDGVLNSALGTDKLDINKLGDEEGLVCSNCYLINPTTNEFCYGCGSPLSKQVTRKQRARGKPVQRN